MTPGAYLVSGYALAMLLNVAFPHLLASAYYRGYMPGTATAVLLILPVTSALLANALSAGRIELRVFAVTGPLAVIAIVALIPLLLLIGSRLVVRGQRPR